MRLPTITEVLYRTEQGKTMPYLCHADDGLEYFVKHRALPARERVAEWLSACLARALNLPIAPFSLVQIPDALMGPDWLRDLGAGIGFGSALQPAREFTLSDVEHLPTELATRVAAFDWWLHNSDRSLTTRGGNPNLLWRTQPGGGLILIDHNLAFEPDFKPSEFLDTHVFAQAFMDLQGHPAQRESIRQSFAQALESAKNAWADIPPAWHFTDAEATLPARWSPEDFMQILARCHDPDTFWSLNTP